MSVCAFCGQVSRTFSGVVTLAVFNMSKPRVLSMRPQGSLRPSDIREILVIKSDHIGDFLLSLPAASIIRQSFPNARISLLCGSWSQDLALKSELFDRVVYVDIFAEVTVDSTRKCWPHTTFLSSILHRSTDQFGIAISSRSCLGAPEGRI
jgi:hypothetical protein